MKNPEFQSIFSEF